MRVGMSWGKKNLNLNGVMANFLNFYTGVGNSSSYGQSNPRPGDRFRFVFSPANVT